MRIGCLQFAPQVGDVDNNLNRADAVLSKANPEDLDILVLPEMAFSGYNFKSLQDISPFLEPSGSGITSLWARTMALKYNCTVLAGYPEKVDVSPNWPTGPEYYNSAIVVNADGETIANYRKAFLYYTDESWALEGNRGFYDGYIPGLGNTAIGFGMDMNPYKFEAPWHAFEFAFHILEVESNLVIVTMSWMTREDRRHFSRMPNEPDMDTLTYWITRLEPLIRSNNEDEIIVVFCNRTGTEEEVTYAGTSAVIGIQEGEVQVYGLLGRGEKDLLVIDTNNRPYAKLLYRPDDMAGTLSNHTLKLEQQQGISNADTRATLASEKPHVQQEKSVRILSDPDRNNTVTSHPSLKPTPMAVRPRLVIPQSPPILPNQQYSEEEVLSAISIKSAKSMQSVKSNESEASVQTIRLNPRPPEDSTPYPDSGLPLSGYPTNGFRNEYEKRIYGGQVVITHDSDTVSPTTPFEGVSPISPLRAWRPHDGIFRTPIAGPGGRTPSTPVGRKPEPFPWSEIKNVTAGSNINASKDEGVGNNSVMGISARSQDAQSPRSNTSSKTSKSKSSDGKTPQKKNQSEKQLSRPSSPKSRNASRSGLRGRTDSSLSQRDISLDVSQHIEQISQRAESRNRYNDNGRSHQQQQNADRLSSPNIGSDTWSSGTDSGMDHLLIPIAASPSILGPGARANIPTPVAIDYYRRPTAQGSPRNVRLQQPDHGSPKSDALNSATNLQNERLQRPDDGSPRSDALKGATNLQNASISGTGQTSARSPDVQDVSARSISRGRQPKRRDTATNAATEDVAFERATSADSMINGILHTRVAKRHSSQKKDARNPSQSNDGSHGEHVHIHSVPDESEFERVEVISCPNCPIHGRHSASSHDASKRASDPTGQRRRAGEVASEEKAGSDRGTRLDKDADKDKGNVVEENARPKDQENAASENQYSSTNEQVRSTSQMELSSERQPLRIRSTYNPSTPRAMVFNPNDVQIEATLAETMGSEREQQLPGWFAVERMGD
ncbi:hypothetical protein HDV63DRAFT_406835 [Trichoderma sp. SZMC 28014]